MTVPLQKILMWRMVSLRVVCWYKCVHFYLMFVIAVLGQIRTTVCQAQLLMRKKLKQYLSLVEEAQDLTVEKRANADDLQVSLSATILVL